MPVSVSQVCPAVQSASETQVTGGGVSQVPVPTLQVCPPVQSLSESQVVGSGASQVPVSVLQVCPPVQSVSELQVVGGGVTQVLVSKLQVCPPVQSLSESQEAGGGVSQMPVPVLQVCPPVQSLSESQLVGGGVSQVPVPRLQVCPPVQSLSESQLPGGGVMASQVLVPRLQVCPGVQSSSESQPSGLGEVGVQNPPKQISPGAHVLPLLPQLVGSPIGTQLPSTQIEFGGHPLTQVPGSLKGTHSSPTQMEPGGHWLFCRTAKRDGVALHEFGSVMATQSPLTQAVAPVHAGSQVAGGCPTGMQALAKQRDPGAQAGEQSSSPLLPGGTGIQVPRTQMLFAGQGTPGAGQLSGSPPMATQVPEMHSFPGPQSTESH